MPQSYKPEFKKKIVRLHIEQGRTCKSITEEHDVSKAGISKRFDILAADVTGGGANLMDDAGLYSRSGN